MYYIDCENCAPYMLGYTESEAIRLVALFGKNYIVDPMSYDQSLAYIWRTLPKSKQKLFNVTIVKDKKDMFRCCYEQA